MKKIAFNGLGTMGAGMAARLLGGGFEVTVYNRTPERAEQLRQAGARVAATPADAAHDADAIITMVADDAASREVWLGPQGALAAARKGTVVIDSSTISPAWVRELSAQCEARGCPLLDAPVTGSRPQAQAGELLFLVGGDADVLERCRLVFKPMSRGVVHLGPNGAGATMKLINNFVCGVQAAGLAEAVAWIGKSGLDKEAAVSILANGAPGSPLVKAVSGRMSNRDYQTNFRLDLMMKDLRYAVQEGARAGVELATGTTALSRFEEAARSGLGERDFSAVVEPLL